MTCYPKAVLEIKARITIPLTKDGLELESFENVDFQKLLSKCKETKASKTKATKLSKELKDGKQRKSK